MGLKYIIILSSDRIYTNVSIKESSVEIIAKISVDFSSNTTFTSTTSQYDGTAASKTAFNELRAYCTYIIAKRKCAITVNDISRPAQNLSITQWLITVSSVTITRSMIVFPNTNY